MVYESATVFPTPEGAQLTLAAAGLDLRLPEARLGVLRARAPGSSTSCRTRSSGRSTASGIGERRAVRDTDVMSGNVKLALTHVVPDLVHKVLKGQDPLHILGSGDQVRHYTYGGDLAHGIRLAMESPAAVNDDFNLSTATSTTVLELAEAIWAQGPHRRPAVPLRQRRRRSSTTSSSGSPTSARPARSSASRRRRRSTRCSTRSSRGSGVESEAGRL